MSAYQTLLNCQEDMVVLQYSYQVIPIKSISPQPSQLPHYTSFISIILTFTTSSASTKVPQCGAHSCKRVCVFQWALFPCALLLPTYVCVLMRSTFLIYPILLMYICAPMRPTSPMCPTFVNMYFLFFSPAFVSPDVPVPQQLVALRALIPFFRRHASSTNLRH